MSLFDDLLTKTQPTPKTEGTVQQDPIIIISESESIGTEEVMLNKPETPPIVVTAPSAITPVETDNSIILGNVSNTGESTIAIDSPSDTVTATAIDDATEEKIEPISSIDLTKKENDNSPLFDIMTQLENKKNATTVETTTNFIPETTLVEMEFNDTEEYITHAIGEVETLMKNIETANTAKIEERDEYKKRKEEFAELEKNAEKEHQKMLEEMAHAEKMKTYLENEKSNKTPKHERVKSKTVAGNDDTFTLAA